MLVSLQSDFSVFVRAVAQADGTITVINACIENGKIMDAWKDSPIDKKFMPFVLPTDYSRCVYQYPTYKEQTKLTLWSFLPVHSIEYIDAKNKFNFDKNKVFTTVRRQK